jgi:RHS repeat-associated protein
MVLGSFALIERANLVARHNLWLDTLPLAQSERTFSGGSVTNTGFAYLHADQLNTPRLATNSSGTVVWRWDSDAFGIGAANQDPDSDTNQVNIRLRFPGQYLDEETGLHYNYFRDYDATTGRYVQSDPIGLAGGLNTYLYVSANPLSRSDPLGLQERAAPGYTFPSYGSPWPVGSEINTRLAEALERAVNGLGACYTISPLLCPFLNENENGSKDNVTPLPGLAEPGVCKEDDTDCLEWMSLLNMQYAQISAFKRAGGDTRLAELQHNRSVAIFCADPECGDLCGRVGRF